ncbi:hypothetical protein RSOLAG22IIIB_09049 [Rhizoctonia solani]|uniref:Uncharacterized protein n=1 Tax=Rhizoctonia solani TaxID=456999 RepID=A0A0K6FX81_9AGAM|nr:hypothetical protein RSOLAG22IIIB_09049 [Rhizoctonia solani]
MSHPDSSTLSVPKTRLHRPDLAHDLPVDIHKKVIPNALTKVFRKGWKIGFPLTILAPSFLDSPDAERLTKAVVKAVTDPSTSIANNAEARAVLKLLQDELAMDMPTWTAAWAQLIILIRTYLPSAHSAWRQHWHNIWARKEQKWHCLMEYDKRIRSYATQQNFDPGCWNKELWDEIIDKDRDRMAQGRAPPTITSYQPPYLPPRPIPNNPHQTTSLPPPPPPYIGSHRKPGLHTSDNRHPSPHRNRNSSAAGRSLSRGLTRDGASMERHSASDSTYHPDAPSTIPSASTSATYAPSAKLPATEPSCVPSGDPRKVSTLLIPNNWEAKIRALGLWDQYSDVPQNLREGFRIGVTKPVNTTFTPPNHKSALDRPDVILAHINAEVDAGRYFGPYTPIHLQQLIGPFTSAPLGVVEKPGAPGKFRIIQDFSYNSPNAPTPPVNNHINPDEFTCSWGFFDDVVRALASAPPGSMAATLDVDAAYRQMPIHPDDQPHIVFFWDGLCWVDTRAPFGLTSSNGIFVSMCWPRAEDDANWWIDTLSTEHIGSSIAAPPPMESLSIFTDASTSFGIGVIIDKEYLSSRLMSGWKSDGRDIGWAEAIAIEIALAWIIFKGFRKTSITIHCDNQGVVYAWKAGRSRNPHQNDAITRITAMALEHNIHIQIQYVNTKDNPADLPSRNVLPPDTIKARNPPKIPDHLIDFLSPFM